MMGSGRAIARRLAPAAALVAGFAVACRAHAGELTPVAEAQVGATGLEDLITEGEYRRPSVWIGAAGGVRFPLGGAWGLRTTLGLGTHAFSEEMESSVTDHYEDNGIGGWESIDIGPGKRQHVRHTALLLRAEPPSAHRDPHRGPR